MQLRAAFQTLPVGAIAAAVSSGAVPLTGLLAEGDSITAALNSSPWNSITEETSPSSYSRLYASERSWITSSNTAVGGSQLGNPGDTLPTNTLYARLAGDLAISGLTHVTVLIGANDQFPGGPNAFLTRVLAYVDEFRSAGIKVAVGTILPRTGVANWNTNRATYNTALRAQVGIGIDAVIDFDTAPIGQDGAESDATLFSDGLHPTRKGHEQLKAVYAATLDAWGGITADDHIAPLLSRLSVEPDATHKNVIRDFIIGLKADDVWNSLYALWLPGVFGNATDALLNVKDASNAMTLIGSPTFTADRGFQGNGTSAALNLNTTPTATYGSTTSFGAWVNAGTDVAGTGYLMGMSVGGNHSSVLRARFTGDFQSGRVNTQIDDVTFGPSSSIMGFHVLERSSNTLTTAYRNGVANGTSVNIESGRVNNPYYLLGQNRAAGTLLNPVDYRTPAAFVGRSMGATKQAALYARLNTLLTAVGAN